MNAPIVAGYRAVSASRHSAFWFAFAVAFALFSAAATAQQTEGGPAVQPPVVPQVQGSDVKSLGDQTGVKQWKPGDAVTVTGDLKEDSPETQSQQGQGQSPQQSQSQTALKPTVLPAVQPQVLEDDLRGLTTSKAYQPGQPVRVIEDLKESGSEN